MCRSIKRLRNPETNPTDDEIRAASLQFVRKVSGFHKPASTNQAVFDEGVEEIALATRRMLDRLTVRTRTSKPKEAEPVETGREA